MKILSKVFLVCIVASVLGVMSGCGNKSAESATEPGEAKNAGVEKFETEYVAARKIAYPNNETELKIMLVGYNTIVYHGEDSVRVGQIWNEHKEEIEHNGSFLLLDGCMRIYFPLRDAIVSYDGKTFVADSCGFLTDSLITDIENISVIGREATEKSVKTNFREKYTPVNIIKADNALIFDMGDKNMEDCGNE